MKIQQVLVIGMVESQRPAVEAAARLAFGGADTGVTALESFSQAQARPVREKALLLLNEPATSLTAGAKTGLDGEALPRWPVVVVGAIAPGAGIEWVTPGELNAAILARSFASAVEKHTLVRENMRLRGDLLTVARRVNHDLRSSLNGVMTASEVLKEIFTAEKPEDVELVHPIADSASEIARLIDQVSFVTKATAAPSASQKITMDELVWKALSRVEAPIQERRAQVTHVEVWPLVHGVGSWIETIWTNLLINALAHGGNPPHVDLGWDETGDEQRFWVADRGPGVVAEKRAALFTPFHRLAETSAARGFGLSVTQRLVELQGGRTGYEPREGGGALFYFTLPKR